MSRDDDCTSALRCKALFLLVLLLSLNGCDLDGEKIVHDFDDRITDVNISNAHSSNGDVLYFGFDLRASPQEDARQYLPFIDYLQQQTGLHFELKFISKNSSIIEELGTGQVHFAAIGAKSYIMANELYGVRSLVRGINPQGKAVYRSMIVVATNSKLKTLADLKNKRLAFGNLHSTQGHLIPRIILQENNISLEQLAGYKYTGSHEQCANSVISGAFDACGMQDTMANKLATQDRLRILYTSRYYPSSGIAVNKDVSQETTTKVQKALLDFDPKVKHKKNLYNWHDTEMPNGFTPANPDDYDELRNWISKLGMLQTKRN